MAGAWRALMLVAGLAAMACEAQHRQGPQARIVAQALQFFNAGRQGQPLFGLLEVLPTPRSEERNCMSAFGRLGRLSRQRILLVDCSPGPERQQEDSQEQPEAPPPEEAASDIDRSKLPPVARNLYDNARNDIINNILRNF
ncbi:neutrophilic granule protein-like isoform X2 [Myotis myotis]|uniref:neutrophilic granule protein-like isoform X2 n=1 Tax=Myotis myotis TaxID=51298 RepID=UPI00174A6DD6|nr:neutrophilic granule protein-like isoform X2 [Myotis myotis]